MKAIHSIKLETDQLQIIKKLLKNEIVYGINKKLDYNRDLYCILENINYVLNDVSKRKDL